jgi:glucosamine kinase
VGDEKSTLGTGSSSSSKVQRVGEARARESLSTAVGEACAQAGISPRQISRACAGITGSARPEIAQVMKEMVRSMVDGEVEIVGDVEVAFEDGFSCRPGAIVIAGTGAIAYGRNSDGQIARAGGWGSLVSDEGSGYWIGVEAVRAALRARDRRADPAFLARLVDGLGVSGFDDLIVRVNAIPAPDFAMLFPVVLSAAESGDEAARAVLSRAGCELGKMAEIVITRLFGSNACEVATHGGVFASNAIVRASFAQQLQTRNPQATLLDHHIDAARGALMRARKSFHPTGASSA